MIHYFAAYSNAHRGKEAKAESAPHPDGSPARATAESEENWIKNRHKTWARLLKQVYEVAPLLCECGSKFEVISVIETRHHSNVVGKIPASIKFVFEVLKLQEDGAGSDAYCF